MSLTVRCPECREYVHVSAAFAGLHAPCPSCKVAIPVPDHERPMSEEEALRHSARRRWEAVTGQPLPSLDEAVNYYVTED